MDEEKDAAKRNAKDTVFCDLFSDNENVFKLYQALHPEDKETTENDVTLVSLNRILTDNIYNDLGFMVKDKLVILVEAQSTWSTNIIIRALMYLMHTYQEYIVEKDKSLYAGTKIELPKPELYVIYTKERKNHPSEMSFKDTFFPGDDCCIDAKVKVLYADDVKSIDDIEAKDERDIIVQYIFFCRVFDAMIKKQGRTVEAVKEIIRICKDKNLIKEYLTKRETEVESIMNNILFDQERETRLYGERKFAEGEAVGEARGKTLGALNAYKELIAKGVMTLEQLLTTVSLTNDEIAALQS